MKDQFEWVTEYMKIRSMKAEFDDRFMSVPHYPKMLHFSKTFDALKNGTWQGKEIPEMLKYLGAICAPLLSSDAPEKTPSKRVSDVEIMKTIRALVAFTLLSHQRAQSSISLRYLEQALERFYRLKVVFSPQRATAARKPRLERDYITQATKAKEEAMENFVASLQSEIYRVTVAQRRTVQKRLK